MGKTITKEQFAQIKKIAKSTANNQTAANRAGVSLETIRRVKKSKTYADYKEILVQARGPNYAERNTVWPSRQRTTTTVKDNRKWWEKLLNI